MAASLGILFLHHAINEVVLNNLSSIRRQNPQATLICMSAGKSLPNGYSLASTPALDKLHSLNPKKGSDWLVCSWFLQRNEICDKWWIVEWDTYSRMPVTEYYLPVWDFPFITSNVIRRFRQPQWPWFRDVKEMPRGYQKYAIGASPFLYLVSDFALKAICTSLIRKPFSIGNAELRFATVANKCGYTPCGYSPPHDQITWIPWNTVSDRKTIFHPVKHCNC
jgi:hypothetical protein